MSSVVIVGEEIVAVVGEEEASVWGSRPGKDGEGATTTAAKNVVSGGGGKFREWI